MEPRAQGRGVGAALIRAAIARASDAAPVVWLGTRKPAWFARHGFAPIGRFTLPLSVLVSKLALVFEQPPSRWAPAIFGGHVFMSLAQS